MTDSGALPQPGWYADPANQLGLRWWDGHAWTEAVRQSPPNTPRVEVAATSVRSASPATEAAAEEPKYIPLSRNWGEEALAANRKKRHAQTLPIWLLALSPAWVGVAFALFTLIWVLSNPIFALVIGGIATIAVVWALTFLDRIRLERRGFAKLPGSMWSLLLPIYFILRAGRVTWDGLPPLIVFFGLATVSAFGGQSWYLRRCGAACG